MTFATEASRFEIVTDTGVAFLDYVRRPDSMVLAHTGARREEGDSRMFCRPASTRRGAKDADRRAVPVRQEVSTGKGRLEPARVPSASREVPRRQSMLR
jgi:hypothetical protein